MLEFIHKGQTVEEIIDVNRKCKRHGIKPVFSLMCAMPTETFEEIERKASL